MDRPNDGQVKFNVDVGPMGCMGYDVVAPASNYGGGDGGGGEGSGEAAYTQRLKSNRLLRILEKILLIGGSIDAEALCVQSGVWVWRLVVDVSLVCDAGNSLDACVLAVVAALRHFRLAQVDVVENMSDERCQEMQIVDSDEKEPTSLPLHHTPVAVTFALFSDKSGATSVVSSLLDPTDREELAADGIVTWSYNKYGEMCCLDFPGGCELSTIQLMSSSDLGKKRCIEICDMLETALTEADNKAQNERMQRLKEVEGKTVASVSDGDITMGNADDADKTTEDEEYRKLALDYASGHIAASVKDNPTSSGNKMTEASSIFYAFLQSVKKTSIDNTLDNAVDKIDAPVVQGKMISGHSQSETKQNTYDEVVTKKAAKLKHNVSISKQKVTMDNSSDEEESAFQLQSEFLSTENNVKSDDEQMKKIEAKESASESVDFRTKMVTKMVTTEPEKVKNKQVDKEDIDDLAMAIKVKKKKGKKKRN